MSNFWDKLGDDTSERTDDRTSVEHLAAVPMTTLGPLVWNVADNEICQQVPQPFERVESREQLKIIDEECRRLKALNKLAKFTTLKALRSYSLLAFDSLDEPTQLKILNSRQAAVDALAYRKHRTELFNLQQAAERQVAAMQQAIKKQLGTGDVPLADDENAIALNCFDWLFYNLQFVSLKWLTLPREFNRRKILADIIVKLFIDGDFTASMIDADFVHKQLAEQSTAWKVVTDKTVVFLLLSRAKPTTFWDLLFDELQILLGRGTSVVVVADTDAGKNIPQDLRTEYLSISKPMNAAFVSNAKIDRTSFVFSHTVNARKVSK
mgnify:CR=1 FL=1